MAAVARTGHDCEWLRQSPSADGIRHRGQWRRNRELLAQCLSRLIKPLAELAANDAHAVEVMEACELKGSRVPEEVAVMGVGNNLLAPVSRDIPISSVDTNLGTLGHLGARLLDEIMRGVAAPRVPVRVTPIGIIKRRSSNRFALSHRGLLATLQFIHAHA